MSLRRPRGLITALAAIVALMTPALTTPALAASSAQVSFPRAQQTFMCTICHEPLNEAHSPEAYQENGELRLLIGRGDTMAQIKHEMVLQFGVAVLAVPPDHGFGLFVFLIPGIVIALGLLIVAVTLPRWRRRATRQHAAETDGPRAGPAISDADAARLDADLARGN